MAGFSDEQLSKRHAGSQLAFYRLLATGHPDSFTATPRDGVEATVAPVSPDRSLPNSVLYTDPAAVLDAYQELAALYDGAGVRAWTVWVQPGDDDLCAALEERGHAIDGTPGLQVANIDELDLEQRVELDLDDDQSAWPIVGRMNDTAYGLPDGALGATVAATPPGDYDLLIARLDGVPVACAVFETFEGDCEAGLVATLPQARGEGLCGELMREGIRRARDAGAQSVTLEASSMGHPIYERIGYRTVGRMRMLELRKAAP